MDRRPWFALRIAMLAVASSMVLNPVAMAQQAAAAPAADSAPDAPPLSQQALDELMAPIALYPDALLAQVLMASTYPLEIVEAARWQKANPNVKDKDLEDAMQQQGWDPSVKSLTSVPQVLTMMNEKLDWTRKLGDAFLAQQEDLLKTAQALRKKAQAAGNLKSSKEMTVSDTTRRKRKTTSRSSRSSSRIRRSSTFPRTTPQSSMAPGGIRPRLRTTTTLRATPMARASRSPRAWSSVPRSGATWVGATTT